MGKIKIKKEDINRILLTELLPYEVPMLFSNEGFYSIVSSGECDRYFKRIYELSEARADKEKRKYGIPFNFEIKKSADGDTRTLSVIHPMNQLNFIELYAKYDSLMLHLCSKSPISLRKISKIAKYYYSPNFVFVENPAKGQEIDLKPDSLDDDLKYLKSYFVNKPIDLIYKFYERYDYQRLEQRFNYLLEFDISKCFYHIYTHSITWAVKNKESAKRNAGERSFENSFDKIMQLANYNETNGIIVGPEISRIFAEIILQQVDINVLDILEKNGDIKYGVDFEIRRYVDDYFVFANDDKILKLIKSIFQQELIFYKLYLNPSKSEIKTTPFLTNIAVGKWEVKKLLNNFFKENIIKESITMSGGETEIIEHINLIESPYKQSQIFIKDFQCIVKQNGLSYDILSKEVIRSFKSMFVKIYKNGIIDKNQKGIENFLLMLLDISFYAYSLNINANTTFKISQIIILTHKFILKKNDDELRNTIYSKIFKDADFVLTNIQRKSKGNDTNIEILNLIIALKQLGDNYLLSEKRIKELLGLKTQEGFTKLNYFQIITLLYYFNDKQKYKEFKNEIENTVVTKFEEDKNPFLKSELTLLFFDFVCCPYVTIDSKRKIIRKSKYTVKSTSNRVVDSLIKSIMDQNSWFMNWDQEKDLEKVLKKKEWGSSY